MKIIVRASGERTEAECIRRASLEGEVVVVRGLTPFWVALRETYRIGVEFNQPWVPVVDADVLLYQGVIQAAIDSLIGADYFCLDGKTDDKILVTTRRAGIHIYNRELLPLALQYVRNSIKPETRVRQVMERKHNGLTYVGDIVFGQHDYEQYYCDLYRKAYLQTVKLGTKVPRYKSKWRGLAKVDDDYRVIIAGHQAGNARRFKHVFDASQYYAAGGAITRLGLTEKGLYAAVPV